MSGTGGKAVANRVLSALGLLKLQTRAGTGAGMRQLFRRKTNTRAASQALALACLCATPVWAQQLSLRRYDISDGLGHGVVTSIYQDTKGYLWFSTYEGLSRFDGYRFTNYDTRDGLSHPIINQVTEDRKGRLWVATNGGGVARLLDGPPRVVANHAAARPTGSNKFVNFPVGDTPGSNRVNRMLFDSQNNLWCLTDGGLYRAVLTDTNLKFAPVALSLGGAYAALEDRRGRLWFGVANELIAMSRDQLINCGPVGGASNDLIAGVIQDRQGRLLVASWRGGLFEFVPAPDPRPCGQWRQLPLALGPKQLINAMLEDASGFLWLGTDDGLVKYRDGQQTIYTTAQGVRLNSVRSLAEDSDGNLWLGTGGGGAFKRRGELIVNYTHAEGLPNPDVAKVFEDRAGRIKAILADSSIAEIGAEKISVNQQLDYPPISSQSFMIEHDEQGRWLWGRRGVWWARFRKPVVHLRCGRDLDLADFFPANAPLVYIHFYEDETGKLWMSRGDGFLYRADATRPGRLNFESFPTDFPLLAASPQMISDRAGGLWLGSRSRLGRLWQGKFAPMEASDGLPEIDPRSFFMDSRGWLWIGLRYKGVSMTKEPSAEHPSFANYSAPQGLSSGAVWSIAEDSFGRMYFGTDKGLDQFDPNTNQWLPYTTKDGLAGDKISQLYKDRGGNIWVATVRGVSRFDPRAERFVSRPAPIYLSRVNIAGEDLLLPETGAAQIPRIELAAARNNLSIEFVALSFQGEDSLTYQYQLEGVDTDWSATTKSRSVNYARLASGTYRFLVRAVNKEGEPSPNPAMFQFRILPPLYLRWWFLSLGAVVLVAAAYGFYRNRVNRAVELERVRTRIATDLHDDIGSSLSRMAILSEVVKRQIGVTSNESVPMLTDIAESARGLVDAMSDIVWAIDPRRDNLTNLVARVGQFASGALEARGISWDLRIPSEFENVKLIAEQRRHLFLIFKEAINNIARHSGCSSASFEIALVHNQLLAEIHDNGRGFTVSPQQSSANEPGGRGLENMQNRAALLGGRLTIHSSPGHGTSLNLAVPLKKFTA